MDVLWKGLVGGVLTALIALLAKKGNILPGILPLFPTLGLIALYILGLKQDPQAFKQASGATLKTIPAYFVFLIICYSPSWLVFGRDNNFSWPRDFIAQKGGSLT